MSDDEIRFEFAKNVATNGRLFSVLLVAISLTMYATGAGRWFALIAVLSALPVGLSCIVDQLPRLYGRIASALVYGFTVAIAIILLVNIG